MERIQIMVRSPILVCREIFLEDPVYRISIATQNVAYNQPTQPGFYFGPDLKEGIFRGYEFKNK